MTPILEFDATFGIHQFSLCLFNKESNDTVLNKENNIIDDLYVTIEDIRLDNISVIESINSISKYTNNQGDSVKTYGHLGFPTEFKFWVQVPGYMFKRNISLFNDQELMDYLQHD
tara:strand:- start:68 stop:412 length:345 start_codon:yes stop_codon:yes gene_type:complete